MTTTINASTSAGLVITPDTSGNIQLQYNGVAAPAFSAAKSSANQSISSSSWTKVTYDTENFDTNNNFASSRFTPTIPGYYQINTSTYLTNGSASVIYAQLYKNGAGFGQYTMLETTGSYIYNYIPVISTIVYMNGTTDYLEMYVYANFSSPIVYTGPTCFSGFLLRGA